MGVKLNHRLRKRKRADSGKNTLVSLKLAFLILVNASSGTAQGQSFLCWSNLRAREKISILSGAMSDSPTLPHDDPSALCWICDFPGDRWHNDILSTPWNPCNLKPCHVLYSFLYNEFCSSINLFIRLFYLVVSILLVSPICIVSVRIVLWNHDGVLTPTQRLQFFIIVRLPDSNSGVCLTFQNIHG